MGKISKIEHRSLPVTLELRATDKGVESVTGKIFYDVESEVMTDIWGDEIVEILAPGCFDESLQNRNVVALWSHEASQVLGNTKSKTLRIDSNEEALSFSLDLPGNTIGKDAAETISRGDVDGVSFGMIVIKDKWANDDGVYVRTILEAELWEISPTVFPAFPANSIQCKSLELFKKETKKMEKDVKKETEIENVKIEKEERTVPFVTVVTDPKKDAMERFNHFLRTGERRDNDSSILTVTGDGGALAPVDFAKEIIDGLADEGVMRKLARILPPVSGKSAVYPRRTGGGGAAMVAEGADIIPHDLEFDQLTLTPKKAAAIVEVSNELLADAGVNIAAYLASHFKEDIGELLEGQYWNGDGSDAELIGILEAKKANNHRLIERIPTEEAAVDVEDIFALWNSLPARYRKNAAFVCNSALEPVLRLLQDGDGRYLMVANMVDDVPYTLLGRPLAIADEFPGALTAGTDALAFGDFNRGVFIADKKGIRIERNDSFGFGRDTVAFRAIFRTDIALALPEALRVLAIKGD